MKLLIDAGHQDTIGDNGAVGEVVEYDRNIAITNALKKYLDFTQVPDKLGSLEKAIEWINKNSTADDVLISIHTNAGGGDGVEIWYYGGSDNSKKKAEEGSAIIAKVASDPNRGAKSDLTSRFGRFGIIRDTKPWAFLIECDFVDDPTGDVKTNVELYTKGIVEFAKTFGFKPKEQKSAVDPKDTEISNLKKQVATLTAQVKDLTAKLATANSQIATLTKQLDDKPKEVIKEVEKYVEVPKEVVKEVEKKLTPEDERKIAENYLHNFVKRIFKTITNFWRK